MLNERRTYVLFHQREELLYLLLDRNSGDKNLQVSSTLTAQPPVKTQPMSKRVSRTPSLELYSAARCAPRRFGPAQLDERRSAISRIGRKTKSWICW